MHGYMGPGFSRMRGGPPSRYGGPPGPGPRWEEGGPPGRWEDGPGRWEDGPGRWEEVPPRWEERRWEEERERERMMIERERDPRPERGDRGRDRGERIDRGERGPRRSRWSSGPAESLPQDPVQTLSGQSDPPRASPQEQSSQKCDENNTAIDKTSQNTPDTHEVQQVGSLDGFKEVSSDKCVQPPLKPSEEPPHFENSEAPFEEPVIKQIEAPHVMALKDSSMQSEAPSKFFDGRRESSESSAQPSVNLDRSNGPPMSSNAESMTHLVGASGDSSMPKRESFESPEPSESFVKDISDAETIHAGSDFSAKQEDSHREPQLTGEDDPPPGQGEVIAEQ